MMTMKLRNSSLFFAMFTVLFLNYLDAQSGLKTVEGYVKNLNNEGLSGATAVLFAADDSVSGLESITDAKGKFRFKDIRNGTYVLNIFHAGFMPSPTIAVKVYSEDKILVLPVIILQPSGETGLKELVVIAQRPFIEHEVDKTIINVEAMPGTTGNNSLEVLQKSPGVHVDENGGIYLNGKANLLLLIDGRETLLNGTDLANYLRSLPSGSIDRIELINNPSSKYDANGGAIINIRLKRNRQAGLTGNLFTDVSQGILFRTADGINLNLNTKKINWFGGLTYSRGANIDDLYSERNLSELSGAREINTILNSYGRFFNHGLIARVGADYHLNPNTVIGIQIRNYSIPRKTDSEFTTDYTGLDQKLDSTISGYSNSEVDSDNINFNINFQRQFPKTKSELTGDFNIVEYHSTGNQFFENSIERAGSGLVRFEDFKYGLLSDSKIYNFKSDYSLSLFNKMNLEAGIKSSFVKNDNDSRYFDLYTGPERLIHNKSNQFIYEENVNAAYFNLRSNNKRMNWQIGMRTENTNLSGQQIGNSEVSASQFTQHFTDLFPSIFLRYKLDTLNRHNLSLNLTRRIVRPGFQMFNSFLVFRDYNFYSSGNPELKPYYAYRAELNYFYKQYLNISAVMHLANGIFTSATEIKEDIIINKTINMGHSLTYSLNASLTNNLLKWWYVNYNFQLVYIKTKGFLNNSNFQINNLGTRLNLINQFKINTNCSLDFSLFYAGRVYQDGLIREPRKYFNAGIQTKVFQQRGTLSFAIEDVFHTWRTYSQVTGINHSSIYQVFGFDSRRVRVAFNYRFGNEKFLRKRKHQDNAADAELQRI